MNKTKVISAQDNCRGEKGVVIVNVSAQVIAVPLSFRDVESLEYLPARMCQDSGHLLPSESYKKVLGKEGVPPTASPGEV